ncbi:MAG TPA: menaquinone biosynthesis protein [Herpetosiphonaceae bacterium]
MTLRLGIIDYLNCQPINWRIAERLPGVEFLHGVPTALNQALLDGRVAVAPISAYEYARHADELLVVGGLSIATLGAVNSVNVFSWFPDPREWQDQPIALTTHSATSVNLLRVLCERHYAVTPTWTAMQPDLDTMLAQCAGALMIGDKALIEATVRRHIGRRGLPYFFDLGDEWLKTTGLPFTFAVWCVRRDRAEEVHEAGIIPALHEAKAEGMQHIDEIAQQYAPRLGLPAGVCAKYLRDLRYDLTESDVAGLKTFLTWALPEFRWEQVAWFDAIAQLEVPA